MEEISKSGNPQIRYLEHNAFENQTQVREFVSGLKKRILPFKFAYIGRAAHTHDELVRSPEYGLADTEAALIKSQFQSHVIPYLNGKTSTVVDIGSGNGMKGALVLWELRKRFSITRYVALDYSYTLLSIAKTNLMVNSDPSLNIEVHQIDFEAKRAVESVKQICSESAAPALFLFLGHTLGNPADRLQTLQNIRKAMSPGDRVLVGVELYQSGKVSKILEHYQNEAFYQAIFNPLTFAGLERSDGQIIISFNEVTRDVVVHFELATGFQIRTLISEDIQINPGEKLRIGVSHRFDKTELQELFSRAGLHMDNLIIDEVESYTLFLANCSI